MVLVINYAEPKNGLKDVKFVFTLFNQQLFVLFDLKMAGTHLGQIWPVS